MAAVDDVDGMFGSDDDDDQHELVQRDDDEMLFGSDDEPESQSARDSSAAAPTKRAARIALGESRTIRGSDPGQGVRIGGTGKADDATSDLAIGS